MSTLKTNNIEHLDASTPSIQTTIGGGTILAGVSTVSGTLSVGTGTSISSPATNTLALGTNSVERFTINSSGVKQIKNGNLNIYQTYIDFSGDVSTPITAASIFRPADNTLAFSTGNAERLRITSAGLVGIGTDNPDKKLTVFTDSNAGYSTATNNTPTAQSLIKLRNKNGTDNTGVNNYAAIEFGIANGATSQGWLGYTRTGNNQGAFFVKQRNAASSYPETIRFPSSGGVTFGGGANTANTLDDYEFGNWTPVLKSSTNVITVTGSQNYYRYIKVGRLVTLFYCINNATTSGTTGGVCTIGGIPFAPSASTTNNRFISGDVMFYNTGFKLDAWPVYPHSATGDLTVNFYSKASAGSNYNSANVNTVGAGSYFFFTFTYYTD